MTLKESWEKCVDTTLVIFKITLLSIHSLLLGFKQKNMTEIINLHIFIFLYTDVVLIPPQSVGGPVLCERVRWWRILALDPIIVWNDIDEVRAEGCCVRASLFSW